MRAARRIVLSVLVAAGCQGGQEREAPPLQGGTPGAAAPTAAPGTEAAAVVAERWVSEADTAWDVDTPSLWTDGTDSRVLVTAKATHDLKVFDGATGATLDPVGRAGDGPGEFMRPNGVLVIDDFVLVVERDNHRVQVLEMPTARSLGSFGAEVLEYPYGLAATGSAADLTLWVTDDYEYEEDVVPDDLTHRLHRFRLRLAAGEAPVVVGHDAFGAADGEGALRVVESIQVDAAAGDVFVADESRKRYLRYGADGSWLGGALAQDFIEGDPEGIVLVQCPAGAGYWVVTDQQDDVSLFRVFERSDRSYVGTFRGEVTTNTDGTSFEHGPVPGFPQGVMYAVHDDRALSAFDWADIAGALDLRSGCGVTGL